MVSDNQSGGDVRVGIAGLCVEVHCPAGPARSALHGRYAPFELRDAPVDLVVDVRPDPTYRNPKRIVREYPGLDARADADGHAFDRADLCVRLEGGSPARAHGTVRDAPSALDTVLRASVSVLLPARGGLLLHASGVTREGRAFLFCGQSGAGKSTAAGLADAERVLSDDLVAVDLSGEVPRAVALPFGGLEAPHVVPGDYPIEVVCLLEQSDAHVLLPVDPAEGLGNLLRCVVHLPLGDPGTGRVLDLVAKLARSVPLRKLRFRKDAGFWEGLRNAGGRSIVGPLLLDQAPLGV